MKKPSAISYQFDRVGPMRLRSSGLPHHRTCGFPHPAVGGVGISPDRWEPIQRSRLYDTNGHIFPLMPRCRGTRQFHWRRVQPLAFSRSSHPQECIIHIAGPLSSFSPSLHGHYPVSKLLRLLLTSPKLSSGRSPRVRTLTLPSCRQALPNAPSDGLRASLFLASSPLAFGLSACSCSCGRSFASGFLQHLPRGQHLAVRLRLAPSPPVVTFQTTSQRPCRAH